MKYWIILIAGVLPFCILNAVFLGSTSWEFWALTASICWLIIFDRIADGSSQ